MVCCIALEQKKFSPSITCFPYWGRQAQQSQVLHPLQYPLCICNCSHSLTWAVRRKWYVKTKVKNFANLNNHSYSVVHAHQWYNQIWEGLQRTIQQGKYHSPDSVVFHRIKIWQLPLIIFQSYMVTLPGLNSSLSTVYGLLPPKP